jgi:hypothetical protein
MENFVRFPTPWAANLQGDGEPWRSRRGRLGTCRVRTKSTFLAQSQVTRTTVKIPGPRPYWWRRLPRVFGSPDLVSSNRIWTLRAPSSFSSGLRGRRPDTSDGRCRALAASWRKRFRSVLTLWSASASKIGRNASVHPHVVIYEGDEIGVDFLAHSHAAVREFCRIGDRVDPAGIRSLSGGGFGFAKSADGFPIHRSCSPA